MRDSFSCARFGAGCILIGLGCASATWDWLVPLLSSFLILTERKDSCNFKAFQSGRWPHSWHSQSFLSGTDLVEMLLLMREFYIEIFCWCGDEKSEAALRQWNTDYVFVPATDSTIVLGLGLKALKFMVFFSWCCRLGTMFWSFVRVGWHYRGGKRLGLHRIPTLTRGRSTEQLSATSEGECVSKRNFDPSFAGCPCRCGKCKLLNMFSEFTKCKVQNFTKCKVEREVQLLSWVIWM